LEWVGLDEDLAGVRFSFGEEFIGKVVGVGVEERD
jgi:hypothetical protein